MISELQQKKRRKKRVRAKIFGTSRRPRLSVFRSNKHIWLQLIDDHSGKTLISASDLELKSDRKSGAGKETPKIRLAGRLGELIAKKAFDKKISAIVFDRGGYKYHGIIKAIAEGARKGELKF